MFYRNLIKCQSPSCYLQASKSLNLILTRSRSKYEGNKQQDFTKLFVKDNQGYTEKPNYPPIVEMSTGFMRELSEQQENRLEYYRSIEKMPSSDEKVVNLTDRASQFNPSHNIKSFRVLKVKKSTLNKILNVQIAANESKIKPINSMVDKDVLKPLLNSDFQRTISDFRYVINELNDEMKPETHREAKEFNRQLEQFLLNYKSRKRDDSIATIEDVPAVEFKSANSIINRNLIASWLKLSKFRLTSLVVLTTLTGHYMGMTSFDSQLMFYTLLGTGLCSSSAAALNQFLEIPYDSQMSRTKNRPLVTHNVTPLHAFTFATLTGLSGIALLAANVNLLTASLGAINLILYSFIYTPMKRFNIANTWIGSIVGAIPPIMGYTAATGSIDLAAISLGLILYSWQFPHFNALSWNIKHDYARAGYRMMVVTNPDLCVRTAFRHSWLIALYCEFMCTELIGSNSWAFGFDSLPVNAYLIYLAWKFKQNPNAKTSRTLFKFSLVHLPALLALLLLSKRSKQSDKQSDKSRPVLADSS